MDYWAASSAEELPKHLLAKAESYRAWLDRTGYMNRMRAAYNAYYGLKKGALAVAEDCKGTRWLNVNHYRNLVNHLIVLCTTNKAQFQARAINADRESLSQSDLAVGLLEYFMDEKGLNSLLTRCVEMGLVLKEGFIERYWDRSLGETVGIDESGSEIKSGDFDFILHTPDNVIRDITKKRRGSKWHLVKDQTNKFDLAAQYPDFAEEIEDAHLEIERASRFSFGAWDNFDEMESDDCTVYRFYHDPCAAIPDGRVCVMVGDTIIDDVPLIAPSREGPRKGRLKAPIHRFAASDVMRSTMGYSPLDDVLPIQDALDRLYAAAVTNNLATAVQSIWSPDPNMSANDLSGLKVLNSAQKPEAIQLTQSSPELYKLIDWLEQRAQMLVGISNINRGQQDTSKMSGSAMALLASQSIQFSATLQAEFAYIVGDLGTGIIEDLQAFAVVPMLAYIGGKNRLAACREFTGEDLRYIRRITVDLGNPLQQTVAGKLQLADTLLERGLITSARQYITAVKTGNVDPLLQDDFSLDQQIRGENEDLTEGKNPPVVILQDHVQHILGHRALYSDDSIVTNPELINSINMHILSHIDMIKQIDPDMAAIIGLPPLPSMQMPPPGPMPGQEGPQPGPQTGEGPGQIAQAPDPLQQASGMPNMPNMPPNAPPNLQASYEQGMPQ